jgi:hypothetical protein
MPLLLLIVDFGAQIGVEDEAQTNGCTHLGSLDEALVALRADGYGGVLV